MRNNENKRPSNGDTTIVHIHYITRAISDIAEDMKEVRKDVKIVSEQVIRNTTSIRLLRWVIPLFLTVFGVTVGVLKLFQ